MSQQETIKVGSRKSELALIQTRHVICLLEQIHKNTKFEIVTMNTLGDKILDVPLPKIGEKSLFTKELEAALLNGSVDFVVHSLKDLPTSLPEKMVIGAVLEREDPRDALILNKKHQNCNLKTLPKGSVIGTSSLRRCAQISRKHPHLIVESIRGNLNTRIKKLDELNKFSAIILAVAGVNRIGWQERISEILEDEEIMYAVGQGALAIECRENDDKIIDLLSPLYDLETAVRVLAERSFLKTLGGGCSAPVAIFSKIDKEEQGTKMILKGGVWSLDGQIEIIQELTEQISYQNQKINPIAITMASCSHSDVAENPRKKQKVQDISIDLLKEDHDKHCPVEIPIGADFMGKCPFLEEAAFDNKIIENLDSIPSKCPFVSSQNIVIDVIENPDIFCGLVAPKGIDRKLFEETRSLGKKLAEKLVQKGALEVMAKAKATIHA